MDFARKGHLSVIVPLTKKQNLCRYVPFVIELHNCPIAQQKQILWHLIPALPNFSGSAMDATGPGQTLAEETWEQWSSVLEVTLSLVWYRDNMGNFVGTFEDDMLDILRDLERVDDIVKLPKEATENDEGIARHGELCQRSDGNLRHRGLYRHPSSCQGQ